LAKWFSGGMKVSTAVKQPDGTYENVGIPPIFEFLSAKVLGGNVAVVTLIFLGCVLFCWVLLAKIRWGRYLYAIGGNEEAARLSGIPVGAMKLLAYGLCGLFSALAGICQAAEELQGDPEAGQTYELTAIAIVVIGGTNLMGGRGGIGLTLLGAMTIGYLEKILSINAVPESYRLILTGAIIIGAVLFQKARK
jgi:ribose transport system permease protein